jgi:hypothetical protein
MFNKDIIIFTSFCVYVSLRVFDFVLFVCISSSADAAGDAGRRVRDDIRHQETRGPCSHVSDSFIAWDSQSYAAHTHEADIQ